MQTNRSRNTALIIYHIADDDSTDAGNFYDPDEWVLEDEESIIEILQSDNSDPFKATAHHLFCATWSNMAWIL